MTRILVVAALAVALLVGPAAAGAQTAAERELVRRYAPIMMLKENPSPPCSRRGEQYIPSPVEITLGNPEVRLRRPRSKGAYEQAPSSPRGPLRPTWPASARTTTSTSPATRGGRAARTRVTRRASWTGAQSVIYAHVARERGVRGIAVQFWFYYWFNQFNDLHESDWEMIQVAFDAATPEEALERGPSELAYAQHAGGERRSWTDPRVEKEETPSGRLRVLRLAREPVLVGALPRQRPERLGARLRRHARAVAGASADPDPRPDLPGRSTPPDAWLTYRGHWGQHEPGVSNGPTGPNMKRQWLEPFRWMSRPPHLDADGAQGRCPGRSGDRCLLRRRQLDARAS